MHNDNFINETYLLNVVYGDVEETPSTTEADGR